MCHHYSGDASKYVGIKSPLGYILTKFCMGHQCIRQPSRTMEGPLHGKVGSAAYALPGRVCNTLCSLLDVYHGSHLQYLENDLS